MSVGSIAVSSVIAVAACAAFSAQGVRWLRVLQREHYEPGSVRRFYVRWANPQRSRNEVHRLPPLPWAMVVLPFVVILIAANGDEAAATLMVFYGFVFPAGLSLKGRTSPLAWTRRLTTVAIVTVVLSLLVATSALLTPRPWIVVVAVLMLEPIFIDLAAWLTRPYENHLATGYVARARARLDAVRPRIVAITGSYGKTSTKHHLAELLGGRHGVVPSPRSYNNRAGLSRAINENLSEGTRIFIAEMGTYGPGEIASLCAWCPPEIAVVTAIGPVHLERMGSLATIAAAKFEITERARTVVLNIDDPELATWVDRLRAAGKVVRTAGSVSSLADVRVTTDVERWQITVNGSVVAIAPPVIGVRESNLACAIAVALELDMTIDEVVGRLTHVTAVSNRMVVATAPSGVMVIDDTFNANPASAASAIGTLMALPINGRRVVVTPGMVEMGDLQYDANARLAELVALRGGELIVIGRTNASALESGYENRPRRFLRRDSAVAWVRANLGPGDGVLYLNDLPDHYP